MFELYVCLWLNYQLNNITTTTHYLTEDPALSKFTSVLTSVLYNFKINHYFVSWEATFFQNYKTQHWPSLVIRSYNQKLSSNLTFPYCFEFIQFSFFARDTRQIYVKMHLLYENRLKEVVIEKENRNFKCGLAIVFSIPGLLCFFIAILCIVYK